jgi:PRTRC genetic system protein D
MDYTVRAIDIGFGQTKLSTGNASKRDGSFSKMAFPSIAERWGGGDLTGGLELRELIRVKVGDEIFVTGPDANLAVRGNSINTPSELFFESKEFMALLITGLAYSEIPKNGIVAMLATGLPIELQMNAESCEQLKRKLIGEHEVPNLNRLGKTRIITVEDAIVLSQPAGTLLANKTSLGAETKRTSLVLDVGSGTFCWLISHGLKPISSRCGQVWGGAAFITQEIIRSIDRHACKNINLQWAVDKAIRENLPYFTINGKHVETAAVEGIILSNTMRNVMHMRQSIGDASDVEFIFLTGGGSHLYKKALQIAFPDRKIILPEGEARYQNLIGYQFLAHAKMDAKNAARK